VIECPRQALLGERARQDDSLTTEGEGANSTNPNPPLIIAATGSELWRELDARELLQIFGIATRVVSMP
jgi:transketolase